MTLQTGVPKSNGGVAPIPSNLYAQWRAQLPGPPALQEAEADPAPSERFLQQVWFHQRLARDRLRSFDGRRVRVLHPGFWNREAGPDFRQAVVQFEAEPPRTGDVEVDLHPAGWRGHRHDENPAYQAVCLHVVWDGDASAKTALPTVALRHALDAPVNELLLWLGSEAAPALPATLAGKCSAPLRALAEEPLRELLRQAALARLQAKAHAIQATARQVGWEQSLWEGLFGALGYKDNVWPMRRIAERLPQLVPSGPASRPTGLAIQARLLGVSGLLPADTPRGSGSLASYLREIWDHWWRERETFADLILPRSVWRLGGLRPANQPPRRLALAAHWLARGDLPERLERWLTAPWSGGALAASLLEVLRVERDDFWSWHWTFRSARLRKPQPLLGERRATDLAINAVLPWLWMRAVTGRNDALRQRVEARYLSWPAAEDNAVLRLARQRLLGGAGARLFRTAALQQGLFQIVRDFCDHSDAICQHCRFPAFVGGLKQ